MPICDYIRDSEHVYTFIKIHILCNKHVVHNVPLLSTASKTKS